VHPLGGFCLFWFHFSSAYEPLHHDRSDFQGKRIGVTLASSANGNPYKLIPKGELASPIPVKDITL
jgi:ABC-type amino acid transport substrate-binding protein